jgi:aryl-alcohol dehydrogenase-like predicted oxidoreductase
VKDCFGPGEARHGFECPEVSERLIAEALYPYPKGLVIASKAGFVRDGPNQWTVNGRPEHLCAACEGSLRRLRVERIDL